MKKVALSAAVCSMAFSANADVVEANAFDSIYFGTGIGGSFLKSDDLEIAKKVQLVANGLQESEEGKLIFTDFRVSPEQTEYEKIDVKANRFIGSFVLGCGKVFSNNVYLGGEFLVDVSKSKKNFTRVQS